MNMQTINQQHRPWWIFITVSLFLFLMNVDGTAVSVGLADMAKSFRMSLSSAQWIINAYMLSGASLLIIGGRLGDRFSHERIFKLGAIIFVLASIGIACAQGHMSLIIFRFLQGVGAAIAWPLSVVLVRHAFPAEKQSLVLGLLAGVMGLSGAIGPPLAGVILAISNWRWLFLINVPVGIVALWIARFAFTKSENKTCDKIDVVSGCLLAFSLLLMLSGLNQASHWGWSSAPFIICISAGASLFAIFIRRQTHLQHPFLNLRLFKNRDLSICLYIRLILQMLWASYFFALSLLLRNVLQLNALKTGGVILMLTIFFGIFSPISGRLIVRFGEKRLLVFGLIISSIAAFSFLNINLHNTVTLAIICLMFAGIGAGLAFPALLSHTLSSVKKENTGIASGLLYTMLFVGMSLGVILDGGIIALQSQHWLSIGLQQLHITLSSEQLLQLQHIAHGVSSTKNIPAIIQHPPSHLPVLVLVQTIYLGAFKHIMFINGLLAVSATIWATRLKALRLIQENLNHA